MLKAIVPLIGGGLTVVCAIALGTILLQKLSLTLSRIEHYAFAFVTGSACLSAVILFLAALHLASKGVFYGLAALLISVVVVRRVRQRTRVSYPSLPPAPRWLIVLALAITTPFFVLYLFTAWAPEVSADGSTYHLGNVLRFALHHGLVPIHDMYGALPEGLEMLFLFAFSIGKHSAAAIVHLAFLLALPVLVISYALRFGLPKAGFLAAVLIFASPVIGKDGSIAYNDVALAAVMFSVFYLVQLWLDSRNDRLLVPAGILAGFCFAIKYTGFVIIPYALIYVFVSLALQRRFNWRPIVLFTVPCLILIAPWLIKNAIYMHNPVSPFFNSVFPNPYVSPRFEHDYTQSMTHFAGTKNIRELALLYTVAGGKVAGFFGPLFLLAPLSLIGLRLPHGRHLLIAAAVFALPILSNGGSRFLIPAAPCLALAIGIGVADTRFAVPLLMVLHGFASWPTIASQYCDRYAWRPELVSIHAALDPKASLEYLRDNLGSSYDMAKVIDSQTPSGSRVFCISNPAEAYCVRELTGNYESLEGNALQHGLWTAVETNRQPVKHITLTFPRIAARRIRVELLRFNPDLVWKVAEFRVLNEGHELPRSTQWKILGHPDPWEAPLAFDNNPASEWSTEQYGARGAFLEIDFGTQTNVDSVLLECSRDAPEELGLEAGMSTGSMIPVRAGIHSTIVNRPAGLRLAAVRMLESYGFKYLLIGDRDFYADDYKKYSRYWGISEAARSGDWTLYHLE